MKSLETGRFDTRQFDTRQWITTVGVLIGVVVIAAALILFAGADPLVGLRGLIEGVSSSPYRISEVFVGAVPVAIIALTLIPALRAGVFSVGAEGQVTIGAILATGSILATRELLGEGAPAFVFWLVGAVAGALGGAVWALLPALLAVRWRVNEILSTLLLNYVAVGILGLTLRTWLASPEDTATPQSERLPEAAALPTLIPGTRAHAGILLVVVVAAIFIWWRRTASSTRLGVFAARPQLALRLGVTRRRAIYSTMAVSGIGAGVVGWIQVAGVNERLLGSVSGGVGFSGLAVALLGALLPTGVVVAAVFFSALTAGAIGMQSATGTIPSSIAEVIKGVLLLGVACIAAVQRTPAAAVAPAGAPAAADADPVAGPGAGAAVEAEAGTSAEAERAEGLR